VGIKLAAGVRTAREIHGPRLRRWLAVLASSCVLAGCQALESIPYAPPQTPESWLTIQPYLTFRYLSRTVFLVQPSTSAIVYALGLLGVAVGLYFLRIRGVHRSRWWWGLALILWGVGALLAGTSYEAFSYHIKCAGRNACRWTSEWEIGYLLLSVASVNAIILAQAYGCASGRARRGLIIYGVVNLALYSALLLVGSLVPVRFLISFEFLLVATAPSVALLMAHNAWRYRRLRRGLDLALLGAWAWLSLTIGAYFLYWMSGLTQRLWAQGIWFSENDVLHLGLILWMVYLATVIAPRLEDQGSLAI